MGIRSWLYWVGRDDAMRALIAFSLIALLASRTVSVKMKNGQGIEVPQIPESFK